MSDKSDINVLNRMVRDNLLLFQLWKDVTILEKSIIFNSKKITLVTGIPPNRLSNDDIENETIEREYLLPVSMTQYKEEYITMECLDRVFKELCPEGTSRIILAIVNTDGTIVFYFIYNGLHKPRKN